MGTPRRASALALVLIAACSAEDRGVPEVPETDSGASDRPAAQRDGSSLTDRPRADVSVSTDVSGADATSADGAAGARDGGANTRELCNNGLDDDANGLVDDGCACIPGTSQMCYPRARAEAGRGLCAWGTQGCEGEGEFGNWTECVGVVTPVDEVCGDGLDQDCNGVADDGARCACQPGASRPCYEGPTGTAGVGICRAGAQTCDPDGRAWGTCLDQVLPRAEICSNRVDDDCDGVVDNGPNCACAPNTTRPCYPGPMSGSAGGRAGRARSSATPAAPPGAPAPAPWARRARSAATASTTTATAPPTTAARPRRGSAWSR